MAWYLLAMPLLLFFSMSSAIPLEAPHRPVTGNYTIRDSEGNICMQMRMAAQFIIGDEFNPPKVVNIDPFKARVWGDCGSPGRIFRIYPNTEPPDVVNEWFLQMTFNKTDVAYNLTVYNVTYRTSPGNGGSYELYRNYLGRCVTLGMSYNCSGPMAWPKKLFGFQVTLWDMHFQPYAEYTKGDYGPVQNCTSPAPVKCGHAPSKATPDTMVFKQEAT